MNTSGLHLVPQGVLVVWEWEWQDDDTVDHISESSDEDVGHNHYNPHIQTDTESDEETDFQLPFPLTGIVARLGAKAAGCSLLGTLLLLRDVFLPGSLKSGND